MRVPSPRHAYEIARRGGIGILDPEDIRKLNAGQKRVLNLMLDFEWHTSGEIDIAAGTMGNPAHRGLGRLNELRKHHGFDYERERIPGTQQFRFRLTEVPRKEPVQVELFGRKAA